MTVPEIITKAIKTARLALADRFPERVAPISRREMRKRTALAQTAPNTFRAAGAGPTIELVTR